MQSHSDTPPAQGRQHLALTLRGPLRVRSTLSRRRRERAPQGSATLKADPPDVRRGAAGEGTFLGVSSAPARGATFDRGTESKNAGQSLVELAFLLPFFCFAIVVYFQLLVLCHNAMVLQASAAHIARAIALSDGPQASSLTQDILAAARLLGRSMPPTIHRNSAPLNPWRPFKGLEVVKTPGGVITAEIRSVLGPKTMFRWALPLTLLTFTAEFPKEPPLPEEE